jgi:BirA family transcriptional regulator, biotin operon repressor / biotin---[acetyl-CoA-carboxylase] ligase
MWGGEWDVRRFDEIGSTNTFVREEAQRGAPEGLVAVADHQTAGRGRLDRRWEAPPGVSLLLSVLFRPDVDPSHLYLGTAAVALAAAEACRQVAGVRPQLKWPNDLLVGEAKLAGVLAEAEFSAGSVASLVIGIGLNVAWPGPPEVGGTCLDDLARERAPVDRARLLESLLSELARRRSQLDTPEGRRTLADEQREHCGTLGRQVRVETAEGVVEGLASGIDDAGHLVVATAAGTRTVAAGDAVHLRPSQGSGSGG